MKAINYILLFTLAMTLFMSCSIDELDTWQEKGRVWFESSDDAIASFKQVEESATEMIIEIPIAMAGMIEDHDREISVEVTADKRDQDTRYEIERPVVIPADSISGALKVKVYKTANLAVVADTVNFSITSSGELETGVQSNLECRLIMVNKYTKPWWWYDYQCGIYSEAKHKVIFEVLGSDDDIRGEGTDPNKYRGWSHADALYNLYLLNKYCEENDLSFRFEDGK